MPPPTRQARAPAPAPAPPAGRAASAGRSPAAPASSVKRKGAGKPAVRLTDKPPRPAGRGAPAEAAPAAEPKQAVDPRLKAALDKNRRNAKELKKHDPAADKAAEAQEAAKPPPNAKLAGAQAEKVGEMEEAEGKKPDSGSFSDLLKREIEKALPKNVESSDNYLNEEETRKLKETAGGNIEQQKQAATGGLKSAAESAPDTTGIPDKEVKPLPPEALPAAAVAPVGARDAMPAPRPDEEVSLQGSKDEVSRRLAANKITTEQLQKANDPRFTAALAAKQTVDANADAAPGKYRVSEQKTIDAAAARAVADERRQVAQMKGVRGRAGADAESRQATAKEQDEARRKAVADNIEKIFGETKKNVEAKLSTLEADVTAMFDAGLDKALKDMRKYISDKKDEWKENRYGSFPLFNAVLWGYDKLKGIDEVPGIKKIYVDANKRFLDDLNGVVDQIAAHVERQLKAAKDEVAAGQKRIGDYVAGLPKDLQEVGRAAEKEIGARFDELRQGIEDKKNDLAQNLAQRYKEARDKAEEAINEMKAEDKGLVAAFVEKIGEVIEILRKFRDRVMGLLKKAAATIDLIVSDPIGFLKNLLAAIKQGLGQFVSNIWEHLKAGFMGWLFGALGGIGIQLPKDFSLPSILSLVLQVLGLTPDRIRARIVKFIGERNMAIIEAVWGAVKTFIDGGPAALWEKIKEYLGNLKEMLVSAVQDWVVTKVIQAAVTKLVTMFNPVGAIIQAIMAIYNTVMFFVERINQILEFVEAVVNSVDKIARGAIGDAASWIEKALARTIPVIISFLARLIGLGGVSDRVKGFILKLQTKVEQAIDKVIDKVLGAIKKLFAAGKSAVGQIVEWWKTKKVFKAADGKTHTLYFSGNGPDAQLMIRSQPQTFVEFINALVVPAGNAPLEDAKKNALEAAKKIDKLKIRPPGEGMQDPEIRKQLDELAIHVSVLTAAAPTNPPSIVIYGGLTTEGGGTYMDAEVLSNNVPEGSEPTDKPPIWEKANRRPEKYVQGHLLNHHVGGPGRAYNLTPITKRCNRRHNTRVEEALKAVVLGGGVVRYKVKAIYGAHPARPVRQKIEDRMKLYKLPADEAKQKADKFKLEVLDYEHKNLPTALEASWAILQYDGKKWVDKDVKPTETIESTLPDDENFPTPP